ncbi:MAG: 5'-methylthioadenosine/S-adenosylhomocysteine nucleosidase [Clostridia bacterium]|nr:5'-methylthioadenosine/S-adenosylhomocysteine nucleosidase [Clostridia bacterium]
MRIAILTAMAEETLPILQTLGSVSDESTIAGVHIRKLLYSNNEIYLATSGIGEIRASMAIQLLKDLFDVELVMNFGFVGALNSELNIGDLVLAKKVCHYQFDLSKIDGTPAGQYDGKDSVFMDLDPSLLSNALQAIRIPVRCVNVASGDVFVAGKENKQILFEKFNCDICEMELAGIQIACDRNNIPLLSVKVVSDKADDSAGESFSAVVERGIAKYSEVIPSLLKMIDEGMKPLPPEKK